MKKSAQLLERTFKTGVTEGSSREQLEKGQERIKRERVEEGQGDPLSEFNRPSIYRGAGLATLGSICIYRHYFSQFPRELGFGVWD